MSNSARFTHGNVLLVDDDLAMRRILAKWLESSGYAVRQAADGLEALEAVEARCPDFLITDWEMPRLDGPGLCSRVLKLDLPHYVYILFVTVRSSSEEIVAGLGVGADDFLTKPVRQEELLARMRSGSRVLRLERRLSQMARTDPLTGLFTRRSFYERLVAQWHRATEHGLPLSCVMADIDFFKRINDTHGHPAGDTVIKAVAHAMREACRDGDLVCRYGGEEFCVLMPHSDEHEAAERTERLCERLRKLVIPVGEEQLQITVSFGVAQKDDDTPTPEQLVDQADQALLCAKQSGRDRVVRFESLSEASSVDIDSDEQSCLFRGLTARHVMSPTVICLHQDDTIGHAAEFFLRSRINSTPVVDSDGKLVGIVSEKDLMATLVSVRYWRRPVREVMKPNVICYEEDAPIRTIYEFLSRVTIRRVVITRDGRPTGTISQGTLLRWFRNLVLTKGLIDSDRLPRIPEMVDAHCPKQRLAETAGELTQQATRLRDRCLEDADDLVPYVVGGATRMQELVTDLLAFSRYANETTGSAAAVQSLLLNSSYMD
ncbi:MAG: diguanylate cyclase [Planctomycetota bacterium]|jgi:diguanylate cyclase (GGDEF)-like protein